MTGPTPERGSDGREESRQPPNQEEPEHQVAAPEHWPWLPRQDDHVLARHPYCETCGSVKVLGREAGLKFGTLTNILGRLVRRLRDEGHTVTEAQRRLILKDLKGREADDRFATPRTTQLNVLADAVGTYTGLDASYVRDVLRSC